MAGSWDVSPGPGGDSWDRPATAPQAPTPVTPSTSRSRRGRGGAGGAGGPAGTGGLQVSQAPVAWLAAGLVAALVGLLLPLADTTLVLGVVGWVLGGLVAIGLLGVFLSRDLQRRSRGMAADSARADALRRGLVVVAVVAVAVNAWVIADAIARGNW